MSVYLRSDIAYGLESGGSVGHVAGVLNSLDRFGVSPIFFTVDQLPTVREDIETHLVRPDDRFRDFSWLPALRFNDICREFLPRRIGSRSVAFVYHRHGAFSYAGLQLARYLGRPLVLEYNGSEVWICRNWQKALPREKLALEIEETVLRGADVIVTVSDPLRCELIERGVVPEAILVNPNGVDAEKYSPSVDGARVLEAFGLEGKTVIGFIGTFGRWHGAEVLAEAFGSLLEQRPELRGIVRLLLIGDGPTMPLVKQVLARYRVEDVCAMAGVVSQSKGPEYLAACDILVSPHVPNPDGSRFFGSPTKLFEYMAMGKGIVASRLEQIGDILVHDETALLVCPNDTGELRTGLHELIEDPGRRRRLGQAARREALQRYTWERHTERIMDKLRERCGCS